MLKTPQTLTRQNYNHFQTNKLPSKPINTNAVDWKWGDGENGHYKSIRGVYSKIDDHSLALITTGYVPEDNPTFFNHIEVKEEKHQDFKKIYFDIKNDNSRRNVENFSKWLINIGQKTYATIFGKKYFKIVLNINFDSTLRVEFPHDKFHDVNPIIFGKGFGHDPRYVGRLQFDFTYNPTTIKFLDVLKQKEEPGTSYDLQKRSAFSQNPNQEYILTNSLKNISDYPENFPFQGPGNGTFNNAREWINKFQSSVIDGDFQVDIALIKGKWYAELYWNNSFNDKIPPQRWDISDGGDFPKHENLDNIEKITFTRNTSFFPYRGWVHTLNFEKTSFNTFKNLSWFFEKYGYQTNDTSYIIFLPKVATVSIIHSNFFSRTVLEKVDIYY